MPYGARTFLHVPMHTATVWPTLGVSLTLFQLQRPLVGLIVADLGELRGQARRLFQRQFSQQDFEHAIERAAVAIGTALALIGGRCRSANEQDDLDTVAAHSADRDVPFPVLKDFGGKLAHILGVTRVPAVVVLDGAFVLRYRGRVDDRYGVAARRPKATRDDLALAVEEILGGKAVSVAETEADGCLLARDRQQPGKLGVTYSKHVARILQERCQVCHRPDQAAPFALHQASAGTPRYCASTRACVKPVPS